MSTNDADASPAGATSRSNIVTILDTSKTITSVQPNGQWMVSAGQPFTPPPKVTTSLSSNGNGFTIEFDAGREDTSAVAEQFNTLCGGVSNEWCVSSFDSSPSELNFYFGVDLGLQANGSTASVTVYLAQGSNWSNNWWIGGGSISNRGVFSANVGGETVTLSIEPYMYDTNGFTFVSANDASSQNNNAD